MGGSGYADGCLKATSTAHLRDLDGARKRGWGGKEKEWVDCAEKDVRAFGISGD